MLPFARPEGQDGILGDGERKHVEARPLNDQDTWRLVDFGVGSMKTATVREERALDQQREWHSKVGNRLHDA